MILELLISNVKLHKMGDALEDVSIVYYQVSHPYLYFGDCIWYNNEYLVDLDTYHFGFLEKAFLFVHLHLDVPEVINKWLLVFIVILLKYFLLLSIHSRHFLNLLSIQLNI